jgi:YesN/AraC family two-component response regulator
MIKLLVVDDEFIERNILAQILTTHYHGDASVQCVENGRRSVDVANLWTPDVVLMDIEMPGLNGIEASRRILKNHPATKIIFITAYSLFSYAHEAGEDRSDGLHPQTGGRPSGHPGG